MSLFDQTTDRVFTEEFHLENGNYQNLCIHCGKFFIGYKRRPACKLCIGLPTIDVLDLNSSQGTK